MGKKVTPFDSAIDELNSQIETGEANLIRQRLALDVLIQLRGQYDPMTVTPALEPDAFVGMSIANAALKYLDTMQSPVSNLDIANALERGGMNHDSKDFRGIWG